MPDRSVERGAPRQCPLNAVLNGRAKKTFSAASRTSDRPAPEQNGIGWEMAVSIEKILCTVLHEAHQRQVEETTNTLLEESEGFYE